MLIFGFCTQDSIVDAGRGSDDTKIRRLKDAGKTFSKQGARPDKDRRKRWTPHEDASQLFSPLSPAGSRFGTGVAVIAAWNLPSFGVLFGEIVGPYLAEALRTKRHFKLRS